MKRWARASLIVAVAFVTASGVSVPSRSADEGSRAVVTRSRAPVTDPAPRPARAVNASEEAPAPVAMGPAPEPWRFWITPPAEHRPAPVDLEAPTGPIRLDVRSGTGPLGPLTDDLPHEVVAVIERIEGEGEGGALRVGAEGVRVSLPGLIPSTRGSMYDFSLLRVEFRGLTP